MPARYGRPLACVAGDQILAELLAGKHGWSADNPDMTSRCITCGRFVGACRECGARYCKRCQPMQHEHGWEPQRGQKQARRQSLRRLLAGRLRPLWLPRRNIRNQSRAPGSPGRVGMRGRRCTSRAWSGLASSPTDSHLRRGQLDALQRPLYAANRAGYRWHNGAPAAALIVAGVLSVPAVTAPAADRAQRDPRPPHPLSSSGWTSPQLASPHHGGHRTRRPPRPGRPPWPGRAQPAR